MYKFFNWFKDDRERYDSWSNMMTSKSGQAISDAIHEKYPAIYLDTDDSRKRAACFNIVQEIINSNSRRTTFQHTWKKAASYEDFKRSMIMYLTADYRGTDLWGYNYSILDFDFMFDILSQYFGLEHDFHSVLYLFYEYYPAKYNRYREITSSPFLSVNVTDDRTHARRSVKLESHPPDALVGWCRLGVHTPELEKNICQAVNDLLDYNASLESGNAEDIVISINVKTGLRTFYNSTRCFMYERERSNNRD